MKEETALFQTHRIITSRQNGIFQHLKKVLTPTGIKKLNQTIVSGGKIVKELLLTKRDVVKALILPSSTALTSLPKAFLHLPACYQLARELFEELDLFNTRGPLLLLEVSPLKKWTKDEAFATKGCTLFLPFQDPENIGVSIRSAVAFGVNRIVILTEGAHPYHPKAVRASAGAVFKVPLFKGPSIRELPPTLPIVALDASGKDIEDFAFPEAFGLLPGLEGPGLPDPWKPHAVKITIADSMESLNGATAVAIALYRWYRFFKPAPE